MLDGILYTSTRSPFGRKVLIGLIEARLVDVIAIRQVATTPTAPAPEILPFNPLGTVPLLVTREGEPLVDSSAIMDAIHTQVPEAGILPADAPARRDTMRRHAYANGALDKATRALGERFRTRHDDTIAHETAHREAILRVLNHLEREAGTWPVDRFDLGDITMVCLLGYLDFRFADTPWRSGRPSLAAWYDSAARRKSVADTQPHE